MEINQEYFNSQIHKATQPLPGSIAMPTHYKLPVKKKYEGLFIIDFFLQLVPRSTKDIWLEKINNQTLLINKKPATELTIVKGGDITEHSSAPKTEPWINTTIELLYSDADIFIINKPAPLPMHPSGRFNRNSLTEILKLAFPKEDLKIIHRLDANTTGIVILGRNKEIVKTIGAQFESKQTQKTYLALVEGLPTEDYFNTNTKIGLDKTAGGGRASSENGIDAFTEFKVLERRKSYNQTLLEVTPHTGRTNQIRLHLAQLEFPIVGDIGYKDSNYFKNHPLTYTTDCLFLHAWKLSFKHHNQDFLIEAPCPQKFR
ncbi:23S rRNA pseudouridine1911/1915/1917 synthase [Wenyingzhuangia heitensis]|uniref:23S rRNA pseudouridine1911/1915/1917 synthase n=1 Tax=Wenyingzhuangia heitensis TaxID=1487859 RepID=A0ABX0UAI1_9FLAO|nr:RluA family pseudouridine synthase [Wenyingzhuangia heitensis]NIJ45825.1 23S rRNA pseudouridine1911/1915/1917 synthase [Wenyingzhuangia heitensis]